MVRTNPFSALMVVWMVLALGVLPVVAQELNTAKLTGTGTQPAAPASLKAGDPFTVAADGAGRLAYADGSYLTLKGGTRGELTRHGVILTVGEARMEFRKQGKEFRIRTPSAYLAVLGTQFDLLVDAGRTEVRLFEGRLGVEPQIPGRTGDPIILEAGHRLTVAGQNVEVVPLPESALPGLPQSDVPASEGPEEGSGEVDQQPESGETAPFLQNPFLGSPTATPEPASPR